MIPVLRFLVPLACECVLFASCSDGGLSRSAGPGTGVDIAGAVSNFPDSVRHWNGAMVPRDRTRLLLHFQSAKSHDDIALRLEPGGLEMEPDPQDARRRVVLHTDTEIWVRSRNREPVDAGALLRVSGALGPELGWVGAVFRAPGPPDTAVAPDSLGRLFSAFPHTLRVYPGSAFADPSRLAELAATLAPYGLEPTETGDAGSSGLVLRWIGEPEGNVYRLADSLAAWEPEKVRNTTLEAAPLLFPG